MKLTKKKNAIYDKIVVVLCKLVRLPYTVLLFILKNNGTLNVKLLDIVVTTVVLSLLNRGSLIGYSLVTVDKYPSFSFLLKIFQT